MQVSDLFRFKNREIKALHLTWIAFFICFYVWFNMAPLASSILRSANWLTKDDLRLFAIANVCLFLYIENRWQVQAIATTLCTAGIQATIVVLALRWRPRSERA